MPLPQDLTKFTTSSPQLITFTAADVLSGTQYIEYDAAATANAFMLTPLVFPSHEALSDATSRRYTSMSAAKDIDFDITINKPIDFEGVAIVSFSVWSQNGGGPRTQSDLTIYLRHWDGTTETQLGTATITTDPNNDGAGFERVRTYSFSMDITKKHFSKGDVLRYTLVGTQATQGGQIFVYHDPFNRTTAGTGTLDTARTQLKIPSTTEP